MDFSPWILDSSSFLSPYHIPVIPVSSRLLLFALTWTGLKTDPKVFREARYRENFSLVQQWKTNTYMMPQALLADTAIAPLPLRAKVSGMKV